MPEPEARVPAGTQARAWRGQGFAELVRDTPGNDPPPLVPPPPVPPPEAPPSLVAAKRASSTVAPCPPPERGPATTGRPAVSSSSPCTVAAPVGAGASTVPGVGLPAL